MHICCLDTNGDPENSDEDEDEKVSIPLTCYIYIERPAAPRVTKGKISDAEKYVQKGPLCFSQLTHTALSC